MSNTPKLPRLNEFQRIVIKIGSALLVSNPDHTLRQSWITALVNEIAAYRAMGKDILIVSSGAIALGRGLIGMKSGSLQLKDSQAAAAMGQIALSRLWSEALSKHNLPAAQILLTLYDTEERRHYLNARATIGNLLSLGAVPIINENDSVATEEIRYGDNDRLAARVAVMCGADCLILLSDIDGFYTKPPKQGGGKRLSLIEAITPEIEAMASDAGSELSRGGMKTKIEAARMASASGCSMVIASGHNDHPLQTIENGGAATWFTPSTSPSKARKAWISGTLDVMGKLTLDSGAVKALKAGRSLLPAGVTKADGAFERGDCVSLISPEGQEIARGLVTYGKAEVALIAGVKSQEINAKLGFSRGDELVHRDDMAMLS